MDESPPIAPDYSADQREELDRIGYLLDELGRFRDRGLVSVGAFEVVSEEKAARRAEIERLGLAAGLLKAARGAADRDARAALALADRARALNPGLFEAWGLGVTLLGRLGESDRAIARCREAADEHGHTALLGRVAALESEQAARGRDAAIGAALARARSASASADLEAVVAACREILELSPIHHGALAMVVGTLVELGRLDEAEGYCERLRLASPRDAAGWSMRIKVLRGRAAAPPSPRPKAEPEILFIDEADPAPPAEPPAAISAGPGWSTVAREFLEDHWQKLILSLAVLLIVVGSTFGAAMVLGDRLWMAEGKCLLATAYTVLFAGFGRGLSAWGADRAGRIMRLTTLIVLPVNFALVGELPGLGRSSPLSLAVLAVDSAAMMALAWLVCRSLGVSGGRGTPIALIAIGMVDAFTPRSAGFGWGFGAILAASGLFAASGEWLARSLGRAREPEEQAGSEAPYFALGLLAFYYLCAVGRIGGYVLQMPPTLYALPAMLAAFAAVRLADGLMASGRPKRSVATLRLAGYGLSAAAFALGLARPAAPLPLYSGNTLAAALVGLALYVHSLRSERRPVFLYAGFAALFLAYFGVHDFLKDYLAGVEGRVGRSLGYGRKLPLPFKALNGLVFNVILAGLSTFFARHWRDHRLAWHCHLIGLPLSVAACVLSGFDPTAAVLTMGGYAVAYAAAAWLFEAPTVAYLACAAFAGSAVAVTSTLGDLTPGARSLSLAAVGLALWGASRALGMERVPAEYRTPVVRSSRAIAVLALSLAAQAAWPTSAPTWTAAAACGALALLYALIGLEAPLATVALAAGSCAAVAALLAIELETARLGWPGDRAWLGAWAAAIGVIDQAIGPGLGRVADRRQARLGRPSRLGAYPLPMSLIGLALAALATWLAGSDLVDRLPGPRAVDLVGVAATMGLVSVGLAMASAWSLPAGWLAHLATLAGASAAVAGSAALGVARGWPVPGTMALTFGGLGLALVGLGDRIRHRDEDWPALYRWPLLADAVLAIALAWTSCLLAWPDSRILAGALTLTAIALALVTRQEPTRSVAHLALASGLAGWLAARGVTGLGGFEVLPRVGLLVLIYLVEALAAAELIRRLARGSEPGESRRAFGTALPGFSAVAATVALALGSAGLMTGDWPRLTGILGLASAVFLRLAGLRRRAESALLGLILAWLATAGVTRWMVGDLALGVVLGWLALVSAVDGLVACGFGWGARRRGLGAIVLGPLDDLGIVAASASFALAIGGAVLTLDAYPMAVGALLLTIPALAVAAAMGRTAWRTYAAVVVGVAAAYLTLFELGRGRTGHVSSLGALASLLALVTWGLHRLASREAWAGWRGVFAVPLRDATIALATLAVVPGWGAPGPLLLASLPFLLLIEAAPAAGWLYPALGLVLASGAFAASGRWGAGALVPSAVAASFACWGLGLGLARWKSVACRRLGIPAGLGYEFPPYHAAMALGAAALAIRLDAVVNRGEVWSASPGVAASVAVLSLLMLKPYPTRWWADGFAFLLTMAAILTFGLRLDSPMSWGLAALTLALFWRGAERGSARVEVDACRSLGVGFDRLSGVFEGWSLGLLALGTLPVACRVIGAVLGSTTLGANLDSPIGPSEWWEGLVAVLLFGANFELAGRARFGAGAGFGLHASATLGLGWLAIAGSPVMTRLGLEPASTLPLVIAVQALATAGMAARAGDGPVSFYGSGLAVVAAILVWDRPGWASAAALLLATAAQGVAAVSTRRSVIAGLGGVLWVLSLFFLAPEVSRLLGWGRPAFQPIAQAVGQAVAALGLVVAGGWGRRRGFGMARVVEGFAAGAIAIATVAVGVSILIQDAPSEAARALVAVGVMGAVGSTCVVLASRWGSMAMAFAAQAAVLLGFAAYRSGFAMPPMGDSAALLVLAGVDLGVAEVAGRGRRAFALPALASGLMLPVISVGLACRRGVVGDESLFALFAAGTFYAATCGRLRWKGLGYASAVLYNAALWVLWSRFGWKLAESPQFYLVPVGFSTILFAEANVGELGRSRVNSIRGAGLALIYLALAVPIWQTASLAAWATVLGVSLLGVFAGIGLRSQAFLWLGLAGFVLDVGFQVGRIGIEHALAKWAIMLALGIALVLFVALNEKRQLLATIRKYVEVVREWD